VKAVEAGCARWYLVHMLFVLQQARLGIDVLHHARRNTCSEPILASTARCRKSQELFSASRDIDVDEFLAHVSEAHMMLVSEWPLVKVSRFFLSYRVHPYHPLTTSSRNRRKYLSLEAMVGTRHDGDGMGSEVATKVKCVERSGGERQVADDG